MKEETSENVRVVWVVSFVAFYNTSNLAAAGRAMGTKADTVRENVRSFENWLHRPLMDETDRPPSPTIEAVAFFPLAVRILDLLNLDTMKGSATRARVTINGVYLENGVKLRTKEANEVGNILASFRNDPTNAIPYSAPEKISGASINMSWYTPSE